MWDSNKNQQDSLMKHLKNVKSINVKPKNVKPINGKPINVDVKKRQGLKTSRA